MINSNTFIKQLCNTRENTPHSKVGWSRVGECLGNQILAKIYPMPFDGHGKTTPGFIGHEYFQKEVFPAGLYIPDMNITVIGHEVPILMRINGDIRWSYVDTAVWNHETKEIEYWDYKFNGFAKYHAKEPKPANVQQLNLYMYLGGTKTGRLWYIDMKDYEEIYMHPISLDVRLANTSIERLQKIQAVEISDWRNKVDGIWANPEKSECKYCKYGIHCLDLLEKECGTRFESLHEAYQYLVKGGSK